MNDLPSKKDHESTGDRHGFRPNGRQIGGGLIAIVLVIFILSNRQEVTVEFLFAEFTTPQWLVLTFTALLGAAVGAAGFARHQRRAARRT